MRKTEEPKENRHYLAMRLDPNLLDRVEKVAKKMRGNPRMIVELCLDAHLPVIEKLMSDFPGENGKSRSQ